MRASFPYSPPAYRFTLQKPRFGAPPPPVNNTSSQEVGVPELKPVKKSKFKRALWIAGITSGLCLGSWGFLSWAQPYKPMYYRFLQGFDRKSLDPDTLNDWKNLNTAIRDPKNPPQVDPVVLARYMKPTIVTITSPNASVLTGSLGTGFFCGPNGLIATNRHVRDMTLDYRDLVRVTLANGRSALAKCIASSNAADISLLMLDPKSVGLTETPYLPLQKNVSDDDMPRSVGSHVYIMGYNGNDESGFSFREGNISAISPFLLKPQTEYQQTQPFSSYRLNISATPGSSGSPIMGPENSVIGLLQGGRSDTHQVAIPAQQL